jgi:TonB family protein
VSLSRLQSGFLLFETPQGLVRVELSLWQRIYLLWTFRNFHQLSIALFNPRQRALVNALFRNNAGVSHSYNPSLVIGMVENFVPPVRISTLAVQKKDQQEEIMQRSQELLKPNRYPAASTSPIWSRFATVFGAISLCVMFVVAWHRIQGIPRSQAHGEPRLQHSNAITLPNLRQNTTPAAMSETLTAIAPSRAPVHRLKATEVAIQPTSIAAIVPAPKPANRLHDTPSTANLGLSDQDTILQASRPPLRFVYPVYPDVRARGVVALTARVDSDGSVRTVRVVSGNRTLAACAIHAVRLWHYRPYLKEGQPVATETNIIISFISDDAISMSFPSSLPATH